MTFFTVVREEYQEGDLDGTSIFKKIYRTQASAIQAAEANALEVFNLLVDPNDGETHEFPGLQEVSANVFEYEISDGNGVVYTLTEMEIEK